MKLEAKLTWGIWALQMIYIVLVDETRSKVNVKLEIWWDILEFEGRWFNRTNTKYVECKFDKSKMKIKG